MRMRRLRISAISYLNTAPLMWDFEHGGPDHQRTREEAVRDFDISYTLPTSCARALAEGTADIGIIPAAAYAASAARDESALQILPEVAIASRRAVRSILLVSKVPTENIRTIALDTSSMTSVALTKILFEKWLGGKRTYTTMAPNLEQMLSEHDAGLLIGDPALQVDRTRYHTLDLAEEWIRHTGKPFVFAFWAVRSAAVLEAAPSLDLPAVFQNSRDHGLEPSSLNQMAREWAPRLDLSQSDIKSYLTQNIHYHLDAGCLEGLRLFYRSGAEIGVLPAAPELRFVSSTLPAAVPATKAVSI